MGGLDVFRNYPDICKNSQGIGIAEPSGDDMKVQVFFNTGPGDLSQIQSDIKAVGIHNLF